MKFELSVRAMRKNFGEDIFEEKVNKLIKEICKDSKVVAEPAHGDRSGGTVSGKGGVKR